MTKNELEEGVLAFQAEGKASRSCWGAERRPKGKGNAGGVAIVGQITGCSEVGPGLGGLQAVLRSLAFIPSALGSLWGF